MPVPNTPLFSIAPFLTTVPYEPIRIVYPVVLRVWVWIIIIHLEEVLINLECSCKSLLVPRGWLGGRGERSTGVIETCRVRVVRFREYAIAVDTDRDIRVVSFALRAGRRSLVDSPRFLDSDELVQVIGCLPLGVVVIGTYATQNEPDHVLRCFLQTLVQFKDHFGDYGNDQNYSKNKLSLFPSSLS